jgi:hypothetical protein
MMSSAIKKGSRRKRLVTLDKVCLACCHRDISTERGQLRIFCHKSHLAASPNCPDYQDNGNGLLLSAIKAEIEQAQQDYRLRFNEIHPDCLSCVQNCCTTPFLDRTPFYPEDVIYYLLCDQALPNVPKDLKHCIFFEKGCTLPTTLRPHVCIEYKCIYQEDLPLNKIGERVHRATIDLLAIVTGDYVGWRGEYTCENSPALKARGMATDKIYDRFDRVWQPLNPTQDLLTIYCSAKKEI